MTIKCFANCLHNISTWKRVKDITFGVYFELAMEKSLIFAMGLALVLAIGINAFELMSRPDDCGCGNNICRDVENNTAIPNEAGCEHFFICIDGHPQANTCPPGQWFLPDIRQCDNSSNPCKFNFECPEDGIHLFPHEEYCYKFIMCFAGYPVVSRCAEGLYWDRKIGKCNFRRYSECPLEVCPDDMHPEDIIFVPSEKYCDKFYICYNGKPKGFWCADGLHFHPDTWQCDFPENVNCTIKDEDDKEPKRPAPHEIDCDEGIYFEPHPNSCEHYFICVDGESIMLDCAPGFWFDPKNQWCDNPENAQCDAGSVPPPKDGEEEDDTEPPPTTTTTTTDRPIPM